MATQNFDSTKALLHDSNFYYIICTDNDGNYTYINNRYKNSFSHVNADMVGKPFHITMHPDDIKVCEEVGGKCYMHPGELFPATIRKHNGQGGYIVTQ
ncbi:MAG: PAS domain-containing protein [Mucilaginibacter sp.]